jgi:hypothetical protein
MVVTCCEEATGLASCMISPISANACSNLAQ